MYYNVVQVYLFMKQDVAGLNQPQTLETYGILKYRSSLLSI